MKRIEMGTGIGVPFASNGRLRLCGLLWGFLLFAAGCVPPAGPGGLGIDAVADRVAEVRSGMSLTPEQWRTVRKYVGVARDFYGYEYVPATVDRYSDDGESIVVESTFGMADGSVRRVRVTGVLSGGEGGEERRVARVEPLSEIAGTP